MAYLIKKNKLGKTSRTQRVTYPKIFFQRLRYFDANEGINPIMVDFIYKNFMISLHNLHVPKMKLRSRVFCDILKNTKIANITDTLMITPTSTAYSWVALSVLNECVPREEGKRGVLSEENRKDTFQNEQTSAVVGEIYEGDFPRDQVRHIFSGRPSSLGTRYRKALWHQPDHGEGLPFYTGTGGIYQP